MKPINIINKLNEAEYIKDRVKPSNKYNTEYDEVLESLCSAYNALYDWGSASDCAESINSAYVDMEKIDPNATLTKRLAKLDKYLDEHWDNFFMDIDSVGDKLPDLIDIAEKLASKKSGIPIDNMKYIQEQIKKVCKECGVEVTLWPRVLHDGNKEIEMAFRNIIDPIEGGELRCIFYLEGNEIDGEVFKAELYGPGDNTIEGTNKEVLEKLISIIRNEAKKQLKNNKKEEVE